MASRSQPLLRSNTLSHLKRLLNYLPRERLRALYVLLPLSIVPGLADLLTIWVVSRLFGSLVGSKLQDHLPGVKVFGGDPLNQSLWLIVLLIGFAWLASLSKLLLQFFQQRLTAKIWIDLSNQVHARVLAQDYEYHLSKSTAKLSAMVLSHVKKTSNSVVNPLLRMVGSIFSIIMLSFGILYLGKGIAALLIVVLIGAYLIASLLITPYLRHASRQKIRLEARTAHILLESLGSIRDIRLSNSERHFREAFLQAGEESKRFSWASELLPVVPRMLIEPFGITIIFAVGAVPALLSGDKGKVLQIIPFLATLAVAALRLTPPLQDFFASLTQLRSGLPVVESILALLDLPSSRPTLTTPGVPTPEGIFPTRSIRLQNVWYRYPSSEDWVLEDVTLSIPVGSRIALVGTTGGGKTTTAHLLLGLLEPQKGCLQLDGIPVSELDLPAWQASCAQVPQFINLLDASILENVAFGQSEEEINQAEVWEALDAAQLDEFVGELPYGLHTPIGENGLQLSGGQRQRLALARAFYRRARFLLLDEATSALDNRTENEVIEALELVGRRCTTVVIAHRLSTVKRCDRIYEFEGGRIKAFGTFEELRHLSESFRELASLEARSAS
ncbi:MAG: ABC transporter ATP-binding protein [Cyanobacteriota bacterium]|nr:ABC transporter ATP-binding protein [Cyanobacteriota bacterium]